LDSLGFGHLLRGQEHLGADLGSFFIEGVKGIKMLFGNDQEMNGSLRVDVPKNYQVLIFKKDFRRQLPSYNLAKYAGHFYLFQIGLSPSEYIFSDQVPFTIGYKEWEDLPNKGPGGRPQDCPAWDGPESSPAVQQSFLLTRHR